MLRVTSPLILVAMGLMGCMGSESDDRRLDLVVTDSAGVTIIDNGWLPERESAAALRPSLEIGVREGDDAYQFFRVVDVKRLGDGAIVVTNGGTRELRIYEPDGTHRATAGGPGQGPGEFRFPSTLVILPGDTIQVQDFLNRVYFCSDGAFLGQKTGDPQVLVDLAQGFGGFSEGGRWLADGTYFTPIYERSEAPPRPGPLYRPRMTLVRMSGDFRDMETLGEFGGILQQYVEVGGRFGVTANVPPFATNAGWALSAGDGTVVVGDNAISQIDRFHPDGTRSIIRWSSEALPVTEREVAVWKDTQRRASWAQNQLPELERAWAMMDIPQTKPYFRRVMVGSDGTLWVDVEDPGEGTTMHVFSPDGRFEGTHRFPGRFTVHDSGPGWVLGVAHDEDEVEYVQLYER